MCLRSVGPSSKSSDDGSELRLSLEQPVNIQMKRGNYHESQSSQWWKPKQISSEKCLSHKSTRVWQYSMKITWITATLWTWFRVMCQFSIFYWIYHRCFFCSFIVGSSALGGQFFFDSGTCSNWEIALNLLSDHSMCSIVHNESHNSPYANPFVKKCSICWILQF